MSTDYAQNGQQGQERQSDLAVMDVGEYKNKRRIKKIFDARDKVEEEWDFAMEAYAMGEITIDGRNILILNAVQEYIREIYNLIEIHQTDLNEDEEIADGFVTPYWHNEDNPLGRIEFETQPPKYFYGLSDVLDAEEYYTESWTETVNHRNMPTSKERYQRTHTVPKKVSIDAYILANQFLAREWNIELAREKDGLPHDEL